MKIFVDLTGKKYSRLTVISRAENNKWGKPMWNCACECGGHGVVSTGNLNSGNVKSCGCLRTEMLQARKKRE